MSDVFVLIHILGAVQGVFLAAILLSPSRRSMANRLLAAVMLVFSIDLGMAAYHTLGIDHVFPHLIGIDFPITFLYGPFLFLYVKLLSSRGDTFRRAYFIHFIPFALVTFYLVPFYFQSSVEKLIMIETPSADPRLGVLEVISHFKIIHAVTYVAFTFVLLRQHSRRIRDNFSSIERINLKWLRNLMVGIVVLAGLSVVIYIVDLGRQPVIGLDPVDVADDFTLLGLAVFVYAIGFLGLRQPEVFDQSVHMDRAHHAWPETRPERRAEVSPENRPTGPVADPKIRYAKSGVSDEAAERYRTALIELMETEKPYRRGNLTLRDLSEALDISPHNLTEVINTRLGLTFYEFVNSYRVEEVKERLANPEHRHLTLLAIATDAGFNSKSSFNSVFKKQTSMTPSAYRKRHGETRMT